MTRDLRRMTGSAAEPNNKTAVMTINRTAKPQRVDRLRGAIPLETSRPEACRTALYGIRTTGACQKAAFWLVGSSTVT